MRSTIDWNEIVPMLKKDLRDTLYLEAITMLSQEAPVMEPYHRLRSPRIAGNTLNKGLRMWGSNGDGGHLCQPARIFRIVKTSTYAPRSGVAGTIWKKMLESKSDIISYPAIAALCKAAGVEKGKVSAIAGQFWARHLLEVVPPKGDPKDHKVGEAY